MTIGQSNYGAVVQVVVPKAIKVVAAFAAGPDELGFLGLVFCDQDNRPIASGDTCRPAHRADDVFIRRIDNALRGIETKAVEMEFLNPVAAIGNEKLAHGIGVRSVEIERIAPVVLMAVGKVVIGKNAQVIAFGPEVIVDDIENDPQA